MDLQSKLQGKYFGKTYNECAKPMGERDGYWCATSLKKDNKVKTWGINKAKWKSATEFCLDHDMEFKILTEDHLNPR